MHLHKRRTLQAAGGRLEAKCTRQQQMALQAALGAHAVLLLALPLSVAGTFVSNGIGSPQSIAAAVCGGRSPHCAVDLDVPPACTNGECPVIFWLHGRGGTGAQSGWPDASDACHAEGFMCVFPTG
jgi:poly(3-hydroxybutyrate) depolymerase